MSSIVRVRTQAAPQALRLEHRAPDRSAVVGLVVFLSLILVASVAAVFSHSLLVLIVAGLTLSVVGPVLVIRWALSSL